MDIRFNGEKDNQEINETLSSDNLDQKLPRAKQSANTLFHFLSRFEYLTDILQSKSIYPRYCEESYSFLPDVFPHLIFPMKCFCDIYLEKLDLHCQDYGDFGIGFQRDAMITLGVQPIQYVNKSSLLKKTLYETANKYLAEYDTILTDDFYSSELFSYLRYSKQLTDKIIPRGDKTKKYNKFLPDEKEWRYVPSLEQLNGIHPFLMPGVSNDEKQKRSNEIEKLKIAGLSYKYDYINYLIVPSTDYKTLLIDYIWQDKTIVEKERLDLISKIIVLEQLREDM